MEPSGWPQDLLVEWVYGFLFPNGTFNPPRLGMAAEEAGHLRKGPGGSTWRYQDGLYRFDGEEWLEGYVRDVLREDFRRNRLSEVKSWCKANFEHRIPTQPSTDYINVRNGILYWQEDPPRLEAHSPEIPTIIQVNAEWDPKADCPEIRAFFASVLPEDCQQFIFEWIGYTLIPTSKFQRALMLEGPRDTGKSTLLLVLGTLLGHDAVTHHTLQSICDERFTRADLYGKLANIYADLDARAVESSGTFKTIATGDPISAEHKYGPSFKFRPFSRLIFSANEPPGTSDQSDAYYKRWLVLPMHNQMTEKEQDPDLERRLASPEELSGLLRESVKGLRRLMNRGRFALPKSMYVAAKQYRANTDTIVAWGGDRLEFATKAKVRLGEAFQDYSEWCSSNNRRPLGLQRFKTHVVEAHKRLSLGMRDGYPVFIGARVKEPETRTVVRAEAHR